MLFDMKREAYLAGCASLQHVPDPVKQDETINEGDSSYRLISIYEIQYS